MTGHHAVLACPTCHAPVGRNALALCASCGSVRAVLSDTLIDFLDGRLVEAQVMLGSECAPVAALASIRSLDDFAEGDGHTLDLAADLGVSKDSTVVDVGCGAAGFLRAVGARFENPTRVGIDRSELALAEGARRSTADETLVLARAHAECLPLRTRRCTHLFCLNALTYMNRRAALDEFARVLSPNGLLIARTEQFWYDLSRLRGATGLRDNAIRMRDLAYGLVVATAGWQPPVSRRWGSRAFLGPRRFRTLLHRAGFEIVRFDTHPQLPTFLGHATQLTVCARLIR